MKFCTGFSIDPEGVEMRALASIVEFDGKDVLEVGCGDGRLTRQFASRCSSVLAIDLEPENIERARTLTDSRDQEAVNFLAGDITRLEVKPASVDLAILSWCI